MREYYEELWRRLPATLTPPQLDRRGSFLLTRAEGARRVLDLGCGDGVFAQLLAARDPEVSITLADVADAALDRARARRPTPPEARYVRVPFDGPLPFADADFDLVWASEVIEHVADTARWLSEVRRVLVPGGRLLVTTPNHGRLRLLLAGAGRVSPPLGDHLHLYDRRSLAEVLAEFGFDATVRAAGPRWGADGLLLAEARR